MYAAPAASLLAVTAAVLAVHYGLQKRAAPVKPPPVVVHPGKNVHAKKKVTFTRLYVVQRGDSFSVIAAKTHTSIAALERLNPHVSPSGLRVGEQIRVK
ncbi:MAG TPA: LysM domain-containing protein [Gaiellaceae bacterium]|jgi:LysM repeat protein